jgi:hypothetical protein
LAIITLTWLISIGCGAKKCLVALVTPALGTACPACLLGCKNQLCAQHPACSTCNAVLVHYCSAYTQCGSAMGEEYTPGGKDGSGKGTLDVFEVQPAHRTCSTRRPLSSIQAVDFCAADSDTEVKICRPVSASPDAQKEAIDTAKHTHVNLVKACKIRHLLTSVRRCCYN